MPKSSKKGQEEMMGFVLIVLIVVIIGVVFLAFALRRPAEGIWRKSAEMDDMLMAMLSFTTNCTIGEKNLSVKELTRACVENKNCASIRACKKLNATLKVMLDEFLGTETEIGGMPIHGYNLTVSVDRNIKIGLWAGNYTGDSFTSSVFIPFLVGFETKNIEVKLKCWLRPAY